MTSLKKYLTSEIKDFLFTELDEGFLVSSDLAFLIEVPIPIRQEDLKAFTEGGLSTTKIADNMAMVIGADDEFKYSVFYLRYFKKLFDEKLVGVFCSKAEQLLRSGSPRKAICYLRAGLQLDPEGLQSMFSYANGCRIWYQSLEGSDETDLISVLKSEANEYFVQVTNHYPDFAPAWYFLGYAYLNAGAYMKASLAFKHYIASSEGQPEEDIQEVKDRIDELEDPIRIEDGKNLLIAGRVEEALSLLEPYTEGKYSNWWPLHFYLAVAYENLGHDAEAIEGYLKVLSLNPSNYDAMTALSELYSKAGDEEKARKYSEKAKLVLANNADDTDR
ncbi:MAG: tetratricopeptide repeat protein [Firmicutes bacterium]|nr:tetratricopeptide repeat protein [Bacillota bacterium]